MSKVMLSYFKSVCEGNLEDMFAKDVESATLNAFNSVGYTPSSNIKKSFDKVWHNSDPSDSLSDFVYSVWRIDSNGC